MQVPSIGGGTKKHKRFILLASAAALSAATFRIVVRIFGFEHWSATLGTLTPSVFVFAAMIHDHRMMRKIHPVNIWGLTAMLALVGGSFILGMTPAGEVVKHGLAWVGRVLKPLY